MTEKQETSDTTAVATTETPAIRSILAPPGNFAAYMTGLIAKADGKGNAIEEEIAEAERGIEAANRAGEPAMAHTWKLRLARRRRELIRAENFTAALRQGYVPLPKMPAVSLRFALEVMPSEVLDCLAEAKEAGVFEEFRVVDGRNADQSGWPRTWSSRKTRDPILVGMIGREIFAVAWWRPD